MSIYRNGLRILSAALAVACLAPALASVASAAEPSTSLLEGTVNINTATVGELELLPGVGEARAQEIVAMRKARGGFKSVDELIDVQGIGPVLLDKMRKHVALTGKTTARAL